MLFQRQQYVDPETHLTQQNQDVLLGLGHDGEFGLWLIASVDRCLLYR